MKNNLVFDDNEVTSNQLLKLTSLLYFKDALVNQQYEDCPALIKRAKGFGARQSEIRKVIAEYFAKGKISRGKKTSGYGGRLKGF